MRRQRHSNLCGSNVEEDVTRGRPQSPGGSRRPRVRLRGPILYDTFTTQLLCGQSILAPAFVWGRWRRRYSVPRPGSARRPSAEWWSIRLASADRHDRRLARRIRRRPSGAWARSAFPVESSCPRSSYFNPREVYPVHGAPDSGPSRTVGFVLRGFRLLKW